jgi:hypothetical protein
MEPSATARTEMTVKLSLSIEEELRLCERATKRGQDVGSYVRTLVEEDLKDSPTLSEILAPIHEDFRQSGMSEEELETFLKDELTAARKERRDKNSTE